MFALKTDRLVVVVKSGSDQIGCVERDSKETLGRLWGHKQAPGMGREEACGQTEGVKRGWF